MFDLEAGTDAVGQGMERLRPGFGELSYQLNTVLPCGRERRLGGFIEKAGTEGPSDDDLNNVSRVGLGARWVVSGRVEYCDTVSFANRYLRRLPVTLGAHR